MPDDVWTSMAPMFRAGGGGSLVEVHFCSAQALQEAKTKVRSSGQCWKEGKCVGPAWLDVKKHMLNDFRVVRFGCSVSKSM